MTLVLLLAGVWILAATAPLLARMFGAAAGWPLAAGLLALAGMAVSLGGAGTVEQTVPWIPAIDVSLRLRMDGLGLLFTLLILVIGAIVLAYSTAYFKGARTGDYYALMAAFAASMTTLVLADDLIVLFVSWELTTLCSYLLILRSGPKAGPPATRTLLVTVAGGLCLLAAVCTIIVHTGTTRLSTALAAPEWTTDPTFAASAAVLVALAAATKAAQFPFHAWLPDAMVAPAPVSAYLHAAAMVKAGIFLLFRFSEATSAAPVWSVLLITLGLITTVIGGVFALQRSDLKSLLAYSTVSHLGLLTVMIGIGTPAALLAASVHVIAHALFKASGFMYVGLLEKRAGSRDIHQVSGLWRSMPVTSAMVVIAAVAMAGLPPTFGFISKEMVLDATWTGSGALLAAVLTLSAAVTVAYCGRMLVHTLPGTPTPLKPASETWPMAAAVAVPAVVVLALGLGSGLADPLLTAVLEAVGAPETVTLHLWHGFTPALGLSALAVTLGITLVLARLRVERGLNRRLFPITGVQVVDAVQASLLNFGRMVGDLTRTDRPAAHLSVPLVGLGVLGTLGLVLIRPPLPGLGAVMWIDGILTLFIAVGVVGTAVARTRLGAVICAGIAGFTVALWFFVLGAADVALTQLLVEILTVVVMVLVLRHLPTHFPRGAPSQRMGSLVIAVLAGVAATTATLALTGRDELSAAGAWFLEHAYDETGGSNIVNTILVDFRALDTLGELVVLALAALSITALLHARREIARPERFAHSRLLEPTEPNTVFLRVFGQILVPLMFAGSLYVLLRGHQLPGGGFIAALVGAAALAMRYLTARTDLAAESRLPHLPIAGAGIVIAALSGLVGYVDGSFLRPLHAELLGQHLTTALVFDVGVYLAVFGVILGALNLLGTPDPSTLAAAARRRPVASKAGERR